jgi:UDPglucose--hexose-1-phosphate uridylyltransferase
VRHTHKVVANGKGRIYKKSQPSRHFKDQRKNMTISFKKITGRTRLLNPFKGNTLDEIPFEIRFDPLTGATGRVFDLPFKAEKPDVARIVDRSKKIFCPFCPSSLEKSTPEFPKDLIPEGRIKVGDATLIPNLAPFEKHAGVAIFSQEHFLPMENLTPETMGHAFSASLLYLKRVAQSDPLSRFFSINWNYMPSAGSSIVHAHLQPNAGEVPTNALREQIEGSRRYWQEHKRDFWQDFVQAERQKEERYLGAIGSSFWVMSFVPASFLPDVQCIFPERLSLLEMNEGDLVCFLEGLSKILKYFLEENVYSFNVSIFSTKEEERHRVNARVSPRLLPRPIGNSDIAYPQIMHKESFTVRPPEADRKRVLQAFSSQR